MPTKGRAPVFRETITESELQESVVQLAQLDGWMLFFLPDWLHSLAQKARQFAAGRRWVPPGFPDLVLMQGLVDERVPARLIFMEFKTQKPGLRMDQLGWLKGLRRIPGVESYVVRPEDWTSGTVDKILRNGPMRDHPGTLKQLARPYVADAVKE